MIARLLAHLRGQWMGALALFLVLTGGAAWAVDGPLAGQNTVGSEDIINGEVKNNDLGVDSVQSGKIADRQVKNADLSIGASSSNTIADGGIQGVDVKSDTLTGSKIDESSLFNDNSLTGADVDESSLAGVASSELVQSSGVVRMDNPFGPMTPLSTPPLIAAGPLTVIGRCTDDGTSGFQDAELEVTSSVGDWSAKTDLDEASGLGSGVGFRLALAHGFGRSESDIVRRSYAVAAPNRLLAGEAFAAANIMGVDCVFGVTGVGGAGGPCFRRGSEQREAGIGGFTPVRDLYGHGRADALERLKRGARVEVRPIRATSLPHAAGHSA